jgi:hypothetical protein
MFRFILNSPRTRALPSANKQSCESQMTRKARQSCGKQGSEIEMNSRIVSEPFEFEMREARKNYYIIKSDDSTITFQSRPIHQVERAESACGIIGMTSSRGKNPSPIETFALIRFSLSFPDVSLQITIPVGTPTDPSATNHLITTSTPRCA